MKFIFLIIVFFFIQFVSGQSSDAYVQYNIEVIALDTSLQTQQAVGLVQNSTMELFLAENKSRVDFKLGELYSTSIIINYLDSLMVFLYSGVNGKLAQVQGFGDGFFNESNPNSKVTFYNESKQILGYNCKKAIISDIKGETIYWYTDEVQLEARGQQVVNSKIPGFLMSFSTVLEGVLMEYEVSSLQKDKIQPQSLFRTEVPEGYQIQK